MISKILLISSPRISSEALNADTGSNKVMREIYPPLGLLYLTSFLKKELPSVEVKVLDLHFESIKESVNGKIVNWFEICKKEIDEFQPDLIGLSILFGASLSYVTEVGTDIKKAYSNIITVGGGVHATGIAKEKNQLSFCDFISLSESEYHLLGLIKYLNGQQSYLKGIVVNNKSLIRSEEDVLSDLERPAELDDLPLPDFSAIDLSNYYKYGKLSAGQTVTDDTPLATLLTSRGCMASCKFCSVRSFNGVGVRPHSPGRVLHEIDVLYNEYNIRHIDFVDDDLTYDKKRAIAIFEGLIKRKYPLTWSVGNGIRIGTLNEEMLDKMVRSGCTYFSIGIESGDPKIMKEMKKPLGLKMLRDKVKLLYQFPEIYYRANFICGFPGETPEQMKMSFDLAEELGLDWSLFSICKPLPGTELYQEVMKSSLVDTADINSDSMDFRFNTSKGIASGEGSSESVLDIVYSQNLRINFITNINLKGRNIKRAVRDFERVTKIANDHAFSWNCLAKGYKALNMPEASRVAMQKTASIIEENKYWRDKFKELDFDIEKEDTKLEYQNSVRA